MGIFSIKKSNLLILKSFIGPFLATFLVSIFLFLMQWIWKYIDDLVGKGLEWHVIARLLLFATANLLSMAMPLAVLISSLMCFGNLTENYEMAALKSAGASLYRILKPAFVAIVLLAISTFYLSNYVVPKANLEFYSLLYDVKQKKPAFNIKPGVFYNEIDNYSIKIAEKGEDNETIRDVIIYEKKGFDNKLNLIKAEHGRMFLSPDGNILNFTLYDGIRYEEMTKEPTYYQRYQHNIMRFGKQTMAFDLSEFKLQMTEKELFKEDHRMMHINMLMEHIDSLDVSISKREKYLKRALTTYNVGIDSLTPTMPVTVAPVLKDTLENTFPAAKRSAILSTAVSTASAMMNIVESNTTYLKTYKGDRRKYVAEWHRKFTLSAVIIVLFLIAAPLGTIVRKGGIGIPMVISVLMFILYYSINLSGEKMAKEGIWPEWLGMWFSTFCLLPVGLFFTYKAGRDSSILNSEFYAKLFKNIRNFFVKLFKPKVQ